MGEMLAAPDRDPFAFDLQRALSHPSHAHGARLRKNVRGRGHAAARGRCNNPRRTAGAPPAPPWRNHFLATERELSDFLKSVETRAFKRSLFHVRNQESALDIVQDSMMRLAEHYGDRPASELPMLFQRILSNCTLDWFRRQKTRNALFSNLGDFESAGGEDDDFNLLDILAVDDGSRRNESAEDETRRNETLRLIEVEIQALPGRQREAFLLRYWEEMDVAETAAAMGCSEGSVKTHCSRAVQSLARALKAKGIQP
jgi:RNA polymerase sigma-70 factor (ECF subfamily)